MEEWPSLEQVIFYSLLPVIFSIYTIFFLTNRTLWIHFLCNAFNSIHSTAINHVPSEKFVEIIEKLVGDNIVYNEIRNLKEESQEKDYAVSSLKREVSALKGIFQEKAHAHERKIAALNVKLHKKTSAKRLLKREVTALNEELQEKDYAVSSHERDVTTLKGMVQEKTSTVRSLKKEVATLKEELQKAKSQEFPKLSDLSNCNFQQLNAIEEKIYNYLQAIKKQQKELKSCPVCLDAAMDTLFDPCGHMTCKNCSPKLSQCPVCRKHISRRIRAFEM